jgi:hypothetical protein
MEKVQLLADTVGWPVESAPRTIHFAVLQIKKEAREGQTN